MHKRSSEPFGGACPLCASPFCSHRHEGRRRHSEPQGFPARPMPQAPTKASMLVEDLRSPTLWPFSAVCMTGEKPTMPAWELSPEEMRWEAYQELRATGVCTKYQIQARLMRKDANAHRDHVIRDLLDQEHDRRLAEADEEMKNMAKGPALMPNAGVLFRGFGAQAPKTFHEDFLAAIGVQQPSLNVFGGRGPTRRFPFGECLHAPTPGPFAGVDPSRAHSAQPAPPAEPAVPKVQPKTKPHASERSSWPSQRTQQPNPVAHTPLERVLDLSTIAESLPTKSAPEIPEELSEMADEETAVSAKFVRNVVQPESPATMPDISTASAMGSMPSTSPEPLVAGADQTKTQVSSRTIKLFCVIIGHGTVFPVTVDAGDCVGDLKETIAEKKRRVVDCDADELSLFAARHAEDGAWMVGDPNSSTDMKALKAGATTASIQALMADELELDSTCDISDYFDENTPSRRVVHLLVKLPSPSANAA